MTSSDPRFQGRKRRPASSAQDAYLTLGLKCPPVLSREEIRAAYRAQALRTHPDKGGDAASFRAVVLAFEILSALHDQSQSTIQKGSHNDSAGPPRPQAAPERKRSTFQGEGTSKAAPAPPAHPAADATQAARENLKSDASVVKGPSRTLASLARLLGRMAKAERLSALGSMSLASRKFFLVFMESRQAESCATGAAASGDPGSKLGLVDPYDEKPKHEDDCDVELSESWGSAPLALLGGNNSEDDSADSDHEQHLEALEDVICQDSEIACAADDSAGVSQDRPLPQQNTSRTGIRNIHCWRTKLCTYYKARIYLDNLQLETRYVRNLEEAISHHIILTQIVVTCRSSCASGEKDFDDALADALECSLRENGTTGQAVGLSIQASLSHRALFGGRGRHEIYSPMVHNVREALSWRRRLVAAKARGDEAVMEVWKDAMQQGRLAKSPQQVALVMAKWTQNREEQERRLREHRALRLEDRRSRRCEHKAWGTKAPRLGAEEQQRRRLARFHRLNKKLARWLARDAERHRRRSHREALQQQRRKSAQQQKLAAEERRAQQAERRAQQAEAARQKAQRSWAYDKHRTFQEIFQRR